jgi:hypothetical protein
MVNKGKPHHSFVYTLYNVTNFIKLPTYFGLTSHHPHWGHTRTLKNIQAYLVRNSLKKHFEICALLGYYAASCDNCLPTFRDNVSVPSSLGLLTREDV